MVVAVTRPLEEDLSGVIDLRRIRSRTVRGATELSLDFRPGADMQFALQQVQGRIATLQAELPAGVQIFAERLTPSIFPMMQFELTGADPMLLRDLAQYTIRPAIGPAPRRGQCRGPGRPGPGGLGGARSRATGEHTTSAPRKWPTGSSVPTSWKPPGGSTGSTASSA